MFKLKFAMDNEAFTDFPHDECARILKTIAKRLEQGEVYGLVHDINGNKVGDWSL